MADTPIPMTDGDITPPPAHASFEPAEPLKGATFEVQPDTDDDIGRTSAQEPVGTRQAIKDQALSLRDQAGERARAYAEDGKTRATDALGQLSQMLNDAAAQVDEKLGGDYGSYARNAADRVQSFSSSIGDASVDDLLNDARDLVRKSPAIAIGIAAAVGFVVARVLSAGLDQRDQPQG